MALETNPRKRPFEITIGPKRIIEKPVQIFCREIEINGLTYAEEAETLYEIFDTLLKQSFGYSEGLIITDDDDTIEFLVESGSAWRNEAGALFPTPEFKSASRDFLKYLRLNPKV